MVRKVREIVRVLEREREREREREVGETKSQMIAK